jgi:hypothetical protein
MRGVAEVEFLVAGACGQERARDNRLCFESLKRSVRGHLGCDDGGDRTLAVHCDYRGEDATVRGDGEFAYVDPMYLCGDRQAEADWCAVARSDRELGCREVLGYDLVFFSAEDQAAPPGLAVQGEILFRCADRERLDVVRLENELSGMKEAEHAKGDFILRG